MTEESQQDKGIRPRTSRRRQDGWKTADRLDKEGWGRKSIILERMRRLRSDLIEDLIATGLAEKEAEEFVEENLIGYRTSGKSATALTAGPDALRLLEEVGTKRVIFDAHFSTPGNDFPRPAEWATLRELAIQYVGGMDKLYERLRALRLDLILDLTTTGLRQEEAVDLVDNNLIGNHYVLTKQQSGPPGLAISPDALRVAEEKGLLVKKRNSTTTPLPEHWKTASQLARRYKSGRWYTSLPVLKRLEHIRGNLVKDLEEAGFSPVEAESLVDNHLIGRRINRQGNEELAGSPEAVRIGEDAQESVRLIPKSELTDKKGDTDRGR